MASTTVLNNPSTRTYEAKGPVYCPICTHTVEVMVTHSGKHALVTPGQKCPRCSGPIDAGYVIRVDRAA
jgi:hypothetical protein